MPATAALMLSPISMIRRPEASEGSVGVLGSLTAMPERRTIRRMPSISVSAHEVEVLASEVLETTRVRVERLPIGFGNDNWRVTDAAGRSYVLKVGPIAS